MRKPWQEARAAAIHEIFERLDSGTDREWAEAIFNAALGSLEDSGYAIAPYLPTDDQTHEGAHAIVQGGLRSGDLARATYVAMLDAWAIGERT